MNRKDDMDHAASTSSAANASALPQRIEFHLAKRSYSSFTDSANIKVQNSSASNTSQSLLTSTENGLDSDIRFHITVRRIGAGLENLGNTCFLNSVLQCLTYTEPLVAYLQSGKHQNSCRIVGFCALCAIQKHVIRALQSTGRILAPKDLVSNLRRISRNFRNARQEDAHEYMVNLLESMHKCCLPSGVPSESPSAYEKSLVHKIFGGCLRSQVKCMQCSYCSNKFDPFLDLSLEIMKADSVYKALVHFTAPEQLDGGERQYQCQHCKQKVRALKQLTVHKAPFVLSIHLKRFGSHISGQKIDKKVQFGPTLNLKPFVSGFYEGDLKYTLYGVLVHAGWSTHSGHYYCFVRTSSGMWYSLDDNRVVQVSEKTVFEQKAYMLFYVRDAKNNVLVKSANISQKEKSVTNAIQNGSSSTSTTTSVGFQNMPSVKPVKEEKTVATAMQNGFCAPSSITPIGSSKSGEKDVGQKVQKDTFAKKFINRDGSDALVLSNMQGSSILSMDKALSKEQSGHKNSGTVLLQPSSEEDKDTVSLSVHNSNIVFLQPSIEKKDKHSVYKLKVEPLACSNGTSEEKGAKSDPLLSVAKPSDNQPDISADRVLKHFQKAGSSFKEVLAVQATDGKADGPKTGGVLVTACGSGMKASNDPSVQKAKKLPKCKVVSMHLATRMLYGGFLSLRQRKKHKKVKQKSQKLVVQKLVDEDMGPSTSHITAAPVEGRSKHSVKKKSEKFPKKRTDAARCDLVINGILPVNDFDVEFQKRIILGNTIHNGGYQPLHCAENPSTLKHQCKGESTCQKWGVNQVQNGTNDNSIRCFETAVAQWDNVDVANSGINTVASESISVGYVPDEWDEEYDRGRRKKVKTSKLSFDGPNPFQEIASRKAAELKKVKRNHYNLANQPFRT